MSDEACNPKCPPPGGVVYRGVWFPGESHNRWPLGCTEAGGSLLASAWLQRVRMRLVILEVMDLVGAQKRFGRLGQFHRSDEILDSGGIVHALAGTVDHMEGAA